MRMARWALLALILSACAAQPRSDDRAGDWFQAGEAEVAARLTVKPNVRPARNVILFIGDGMGPTTVTAARIFDGQSRGQSGEENFLSFEKFPYTALIKTYNANQQVPDSAGTASAMNTGIKTRAGVLGISAAARRGVCADTLAHRVPTMGETAAKAGKAVGIVTTTRLTHATPAAVYAHVADREWEGDGDMPAEALQSGCTSIARQLIEFSTGSGIDVAFGGGREKFGEDLIGRWRARFPNGRLIEDRQALAALDATQGGQVLGVFNRSHLTYMMDRKAESDEPTLSEMTAKAIDILSRRKHGYYLMVEGGRIDHAHHEGVAGKALMEVQEFAKAIQTAVDKVDLNDTLILVTADHSHVFTMAGYPKRGNPILGLVAGNDEHGEPKSEPSRALDGKPYTTLGYHNGPGAVSGSRPEPSTDPAARQQALVPTYTRAGDRDLPTETHGGEDVALYAIGPRAYLVGGVLEQHVIYHLMSRAFGWHER